MKKKLLLTFAMIIVFALTLAFTVSAGSIHNESTVDYDKAVKLGTQFTLEDGTVTDTVPIFDGEDALIWFLHDGKLKSIHADDNDTGEDGNYVEYLCAKGGALILANVIIHLGSETVNIKDIVVFNIMDDDIDSYYNPKISQTVKGTEPFIHLCETFNRDNKNPNRSMALEYAFLRLDTYNIAGKAFAFCTSLKYINLEDLTSLIKIGSMDGFNYGACFWGCSSLFSGQMLDLSKTKITALTWGSQSANGNFAGTPIGEIKFPLTLKTISSADFADCKNLTTVYFGNKVASIAQNAFDGCTALKTVYYVGTVEELQASPIDDVLVNGVTISYTEYKNLTQEQQKSKQYIVYDYSICEYAGGVHSDITERNACVSVCNICNSLIVNHKEKNNLSVTVNYISYIADGNKITVCNNEECGYTEAVVVPALFTCLGYSARENGIGGIAIGFTVNNAAIKDYEETTGKAVKYGVFVVLQIRLGDNDVFTENGTAAEGVISAEINNNQFAAFELKIIGFDDEQKDTKFAMGAYVSVTDGEATEYSYIQSGTLNENEKYCFVSYNDIVGKPSV